MRGQVLKEANGEGGRQADILWKTRQQKKGRGRRGSNREKSNRHFEQKAKLLPLALLEALPRLRSLEVVGGVEEVGHGWIGRERERARQRERKSSSASFRRLLAEDSVGDCVRVSKLFSIFIHTFT